jgi:outer membrane protein assembly factor BamB
VAPPFRFWEDGTVGVAVATGTLQILLFDAASGHLERTCTLTETVSGELDGSHLEDGLLSWSTGLWRFALKGNPDGWRLELPGEGTSLATAPVRHEGRVYVATSTGFLLALDDDTGARLWRYRTRGQAVTGGLAVTLRGPLVLTRTGFLYAFNR